MLYASIFRNISWIMSNIHETVIGGRHVNGSDLLAALHVASEASASLPYSSSTSPAIEPGDTLIPNSCSFS